MVEDLTQDLALIDQRIAELQSLSAQRDQLSIRLQQAVTRHLTGKGSQAELTNAQRDLDAAARASSDLSQARTARELTQQALATAAGAQRKLHCEAIAADYDAAYALLRQQGQDMVTTLQNLRRLASTYTALTGHNLLDPRLYRLDLPQLRDPNFAYDGTTGREVLGGPI